MSVSDGSPKPRRRARPSALAVADVGEATAPTLVPLLRPLTPREESLHLVRNQLTFISGAAYAIRRQLERGELDGGAAGAARERLARIERAVRAIDALLND